MPTLSRQDAVFVLDLGGGENRFDPASLDGIEAALDEVVAAEGPKALVTTATGRFWSNGLDLEWMATAPEESRAFVDRVHALFARVLTLPLVTVAAVQGHCYAAGAMLALAHDTRVMRADRGFLCLPEVDIAIPFTPGMGALIQSRLTPQTALEAMTTGRRYGGVEAAAAGLVTVAVEEDRVLPEAVQRAAALAGKAGPTIGTIKERMHERVLELLALPA